jgi:opacity protein-like surface antigen
MKKLLLTTVLALSFSTVSFSQKKGAVEFGFNVGYNASTISNSDVSADEASGFNFAGSLDYYFSERWSIKGKLIYDQKGWDNGFMEDTNGFDYVTDFNINYLTVPVMANWHFGRKRNWFLEFGPYVGFLLNAEDVRFGTDVTEAFNPTDFGLALGIGVKIPVSDKIKLFFEYEGQGGFNDVFKVNDFSSVTNSRSSLNVGINFLMK